MNAKEHEEACQKDKDKATARKIFVNDLGKVAIEYAAELGSFSDHQKTCQFFFALTFEMTKWILEGSEGNLGFDGDFNFQLQAKFLFTDKMLPMIIAFAECREEQWDIVCSLIKWSVRLYLHPMETPLFVQRMNVVRDFSYKMPTPR